MDDKKIVKLNIETQQPQIQKEEQKLKSGFLQTNPIIQKMLLLNAQNKKGKLSFKDLFKQ